MGIDLSPFHSFYGLSKLKSDYVNLNMWTYPVDGLLQMEEINPDTRDMHYRLPLHERP